MEKVERLVKQYRVAAEHLLLGRPRSWVHRETQVPRDVINHIAQGLGFTSRQGVWMGGLEQYDGIEQAVKEQWPFSEIVRTFNVNHKTVRSWFPDYKGFGREGSRGGVMVRRLKVAAGQGERWFG